MTVYFDDNSYIQIQRQDGHHYITIRAVYAGSDIDGTDIDFILDTGAFMTVISRDIAREFGYDKLYLSKNPNPRPYREILACGGVFAVKSND